MSDFQRVLEEARSVLGKSSDIANITEGKMTKDAFLKATKLLLGVPSEMSAVKVVLDFRTEDGLLVAKAVYRKDKEPIFLRADGKEDEEGGK
jgi:hypothetical protein